MYLKRKNTTRQTQPQASTHPFDPPFDWENKNQTRVLTPEAAAYLSATIGSPPESLSSVRQGCGIHGTWRDHKMQARAGGGKEGWNRRGGGGEGEILL